MNGGHRLAYDYILAAVRGGERVLDLGAGFSLLATWLEQRGCKVTAADLSRDRLESVPNRKYAISAGDVTKPEWWAQFQDVGFDLVVAKYSIQHMLGRQAYVWSEVARALNSKGRFIHAGRYCEISPAYERDRDDPLLSNNEITIRALAMNSGMTVADQQLYRYENEWFRKALPSEANAILSTMVKDS